MDSHYCLTAKGWDYWEELSPNPPPDANHPLRWDRNLPDDNADFGSGISATAGHRPYWYPERRIAHSHAYTYTYTYDGAYPYRDTWA